MPIFDQGYQHWTGDVQGHGWRWWTVTRHGVRVGLKSRILRYVLIAAWVPALALVLLLCLWGLLEQKSTAISGFIQLVQTMQPGLVADPHAYRIDIWRLAYSYFLRSELWFSMLLILLVGPSLISQDLRFNALPLYFSRPLRRIDYFLGKLGVIVVFIGMVMILPSIVAYVMGLLFSLDITIVRDTFSILVASLVFGLIIAFSGGLLILALSALSRSSRYVALFWLGVWSVSGVISVSLQGVDSEERRHAYFNKVTYPRSDGRDDDQLREARRKWREERQYAYAEYRLAELEFSKTDWRPLVSYSRNLNRLGQELMHTNETWEKLSLLQPDARLREELLARYLGPKFPWYWSAGVLAGLLGLSAVVLNFSVKSLDKLK